MQQPRHSLLSVLSIALGVAVFLAITIANRRAVASFQQSFAQIAGGADLEIRGNIPETFFPVVQRCSGIAAATPLIESMVTLPDFPGESLHIVGVDPFSAGEVLSLQPMLGGAGQADLGEWLGTESVMAVSAEFLLKHHMKQGDHIRLQGPGAPRSVKIGFLMARSSPAAQGRVAAMDLAEVQEWMGTPGEITSILIRLQNPEQKDAVIHRLKRLLPGTLSISPPEQRSRQVEVMLSAFRMNLTALSLISLMVGMFFVANTASASVIRNRLVLGILQAVGVGRRMIMVMVLAGAACCGVAGSLCGVLISPLLASVLSGPVARTVSALYLPVEVHGGWPEFLDLAAGVAAGVAASLAAAWIPARQASRVDAAQVLHPGAATEIFSLPANRLAFLGGAFLAIAGILSAGALTTGPALLGFGAAFLVLSGFSLMAPKAMLIMGGRINAVRKRSEAALSPGWPIVRLAVEQQRRSLHRTAPTVAALAAAVAMMVGITVMIHSFRGSVVAWAGRTLEADLFIAPAANEVLGLVQILPPGAAAWWKARPEVKDVGTFREFEARTFRDEPVTLGVISGSARGEIDFIHGLRAENERKRKAILLGEGVTISESLARRLHLGPGGTLTLITPRGELPLRVIDLYRDYTHDRGMAMVGADLFRRFWGEQGIHSLAVEFVSGISEQRLESDQRAFEEAFGGQEAFACYSNRTLRARILEIFNQTFAVTAVLRAISIAVAVGGVMLTLKMLVLERVRDIGVLRALGASSRQIVNMMLVEAAMIGMMASAIGLASGSVLALVLTWVINKAFFGWSVDLSYPWEDLMAVPFWMTAVALVAGAIPAFQAATISPASALRME
jgi:putative ABC transport system permease protein